MEDALDSVILTFKIHSTQYPDPQKQELHKQQLMDTTCISLQRITMNLVGEEVEESVSKYDKPYR